MKAKSFRPLAMLLALALTTSLAVHAERADDSERKSKNAMAEGTIGSTSIKIEYGSPKVNEREIWGALVPFDKLWRTGADEATTVSFSTDVMVNGTAVPQGTYALFTKPGKDHWEVVLNKVTDQWGSYDHDPAQDQARIKATPSMGEMTEALTFNVNDDSVSLHWEKLVLELEVASAE